MADTRDAIDVDLRIGTEPGVDPDVTLVADVLDDLTCNAPAWLTWKRGDEHKEAHAALARINHRLSDGETIARTCRLLRAMDHGDIADRIADAFTDLED